MKAFRVLIVMNEADQALCTKALASSGLDFRCASDCAWARELLMRYRDIRVVVTALGLPDGNWWSLYKTLMELDLCAQLIVCLPDANHSAREILAHGAFAVLTLPLQADQLLPLITAAAAAGPPAKANMRASKGAGRVIG